MRATLGRRMVLAAASALSFLALVSVAAAPAPVSRPVAASGTPRASIAVAAAETPARTVAAAATATPEATPQPAAGTPTGPTDVAIPYLGETTITPSAPWTIADCAGPLAASPLVVSCDASQIALAAPAFDPDAGRTVLPVTLTDGARTLRIQYRVTLASPEAPTLALPTSARPVAAGALLRIPISDLGVRCILCGEGGTLRVHAVEPVDAGTAWVTPTHVVFRASATYRGAAEVQFWYGDDVGTETGASLSVYVYPGTDTPLLAMDLFVPLAADGTATVDLTALVVAAGAEPEPAVLIACGQALTGTVACAADGTAHYAGPGRADQFGFQFGAGGERAFGSVTFVPEDDPRVAGGQGVVPTAPDGRDPQEPLPTMFVPPVPRTEGDVSTGLFRALVEMLDRVGAR